MNDYITKEKSKKRERKRKEVDKNKETIISEKGASFLFVCKKPLKYKDDYIMQHRYYLVVEKTDKKFLMIFTIDKNIVRIPLKKENLFIYFRPVSNKNKYWKDYVDWLKSHKQKTKLKSKFKNKKFKKRK